jgi:hypothetical protein
MSHERIKKPPKVRRLMENSLFNYCTRITTSAARGCGDGLQLIERTDF